MTNDLVSILQHAINYSVILTFQLLLILLIRKRVLRYFGAANAYRLWLLPVIWLPISVLDWSWLKPASFNFPWQEHSGMGPDGQHLFGPLIDLLPFSLDLAGTVDFEAGAPGTVQVWVALGLVWLACATVLLCLLLYRLARFSTFVVNNARPATANELTAIQSSSYLWTQTRVLTLEGIRSPAIYGFRKAALLLPPDFTALYDADERHIMLSHEAVHLARRDNLWNLLAACLRIIFWINPFIHIAHRAFRLDQELSCDAAALRNCNSTQSRRFARTLLETLARSSTASSPPSLTAWDSVRELKERSIMVKQHLKTRSQPLLATACLLGLGFSGAGFTVIFPGFISPPALAAEVDEFRTETLTRDFYEKIEQVMAFSSQEQYAEAQIILDELTVQYEAGGLNDYEAYALWQFHASLAQAQERYPQAIAAYEEILGLNNVTDEQRGQTLTMLGSLHLALEQFERAIDYFLRVIDMPGEADSDIALRTGIAFYQLDRFEEALSFVEQAIATDEDDPSYSTLQLLRAIYLTLEDYGNGERVARDMVERFDDPSDDELLEQIERHLENL